MPGRHTKSKHIGEGSRPTISDRAEELGCFRRQNRIAAYAALKVGKLPVMAAISKSLQYPAVDQPSRESHPDPGPRLNGIGNVGRNEIVEGPVKMGQRRVNGHPGDGQRCGRLATGPDRAGCPSGIGDACPSG
jgi:hypothetical protein